MSSILKRLRMVALVAAAVATASAGVAGLSGDPGASAAQRAAAAVGGVSLKAATWNMCAELTACPKVTLADERARAARLVSLVKDNGLTVVMVQQACEWQVQKALADLGTGWNSYFATYRQWDDGRGGNGYTTWPGRHVRACANAKWAGAPKPFATPSGTLGGTAHGYGVGILVKGKIDSLVTYNLPAPEAPWGFDTPLVCVRKIDSAATAVRVCSVHYSSHSADPDGTFRRAQSARVQQIVRSFGDERVLIGGTLEDYPRDGAPGRRSTTNDAVYDVMRECGQTDTGADGDPANDLRTGTDTMRYATGGNGKTDYLFVRSGAGNGLGMVGACTVQKIDATSQPYTPHGAVIGTFTDI